MIHRRDCARLISLFGAILTTFGCAGQAGMLGETPSPTPTPGAQAQVKELPPNQAIQVCMTVARTLDKNGDDEGALEQYARVVALDPNNSAALRRMAVIHDRRCEFQQADAAYRKVAKATPKDANLFNDWGYSYYLRNNWPEAEKQLRHAIEIDPKNERAHANLGLALGQQDRYSDALKEFQAASMSESEAHSNLAFVLWSQGKLEEAHRECQIARRLDPSSTKAKEMMARLEGLPRAGTKSDGSALNGGSQARTRPSANRRTPARVSSSSTINGAPGDPVNGTKTSQANGGYTLPPGWAPMTSYPPKAPEGGSGVITRQQ